MTVRNSAKATAIEIKQFWERARLPTKNHYKIIAQIEKLFYKWKKMKKSISKPTKTQQDNETAFVVTLDDLFDVAHSDAMTLVTVTEDKEFLSAQREKGRRGCMGAVDVRLYRQEKNRALRDEMAEGRKQKEAQRQSTLLNTTSNIISSEDENDTVSEDEEQFLVKDPAKSRARSSKKSKLSTEILTPALSSALDRTKTSDRSATFILSAAAEAYGDKTKTLSRETIRRVRRTNRETIATELRLAFAPDVSLTVHWDGKLLPELTSKEKVDRLAVLVSGCGVMKLLGVPKIVTGTGKAQAEAVFALVNEWKIADRINCMSFDTTASNTGVNNGACTLLEEMFDKNLLSLACRHHILELIIAAIFNPLFGPSSGPNIQLFERFSRSWKELNVNEYESGLVDPAIAPKLELLKDDTLEFIRQQLTQFQPRHDYDELLRLALMFLGAEPAECQQIRAPGACHRARWMAKIIYCIKIYLFRSQFRLTASELKGLREINSFFIQVIKIFCLILCMQFMF